jgi:thiol-disulfide isomerase/thioredoxin
MTDFVSILGKELRQPDGTTVATADRIGTKEVLALYFSAHWCGPCRGFTPTLSKKYTELQEAGKSFEMVFVSSDKDEGGFNEYHKEMTFLALPYSARDTKAKLSKMFKVRSLLNLLSPLAMLTPLILLTLLNVLSPLAMPTPPTLLTLLTLLTLPTRPTRLTRLTRLTLPTLLTLLTGERHPEPGFRRSQNWQANH